MHIFIVGFLKPESFAHERTDEVAIVAFSNMIFKGLRVVLDIKGAIEMVGVVKYEKKFSVFIYLLYYTVLSPCKLKFSWRV